MKHVPQRTCIVCRKQGDKSEFVRIVRTKDGTVALDRTGKLDGRGAYICAGGSCIDELKKKRALSKAFKTQIEPSVYDDLINAFKAEEHGS